MSEFNGKKVSYATLKDGPIFIPSYGQLRAELSSTGDGVHKAVEMTIDEPFVILEITDKVGKKITDLIPLTSFSHLVLAK